MIVKLPEMGARKPSRGAGAAVVLAMGATLLILAARLHSVAKLGTPVPFWDEWDPDWISMFLPPEAGRPGVAALFAAHNGHRIVLGRLVSLALFWCAGRHWDVMSGVVLDQLLFSVFAGAWLVWVSRGFGFYPLAVMLTAGSALLSNPFGWEAQTWAFEAQIYVCVILSVTAFAILAQAGPERSSFWCGVGMACLSVLSFGAGMATVLAAFTVVASRDVFGTRRARASIALVVLGAAGIALAAVTEATAVPVRHPVGEMIWVAFRVLSWPLGPAWLALVYAPAVLLVGWGLFQRAPRDGMVWFAVAIGVWQAALAGQIALARFDEPITSRYTEFLVIGLVANLAFALRLWQTPWVAARIWRRVGAGAAVLLWCGAMTLGFADRTPHLMMEWAGKRGDDDRHAAQVARYLKTGDAALLTVPRAIPYHTPDRLGEMLRQGAASGIFEPILWQGDTPARDRWRKTMNRYATWSSITGAVLLLTALSRQRPKIAKVFWFFFSKKNTLSSL